MDDMSSAMFSVAIAAGSAPDAMRCCAEPRLLRNYGMWLTPPVGVARRHEPPPTTNIPYEGERHARISIVSTSYAR